MKTILISLLFLSLKTFALPDQVHFFFISPEVVTGANIYPFAFSKLIASNTSGSRLDCVPMGDGCFNPQVGFLSDDVNEEKKAADEKILKTIDSTDIDMISCVDGNYFDVFCGKAKKSGPSKVELEIWIDTSSSMRNIDYNKDPNFCERRVIARKFQDSCKGKVNIQLFDTSIKQMGDLASTCVNYGLNDQKRIMRWISDSSVKNLYVFTDIDELSLELRDYLDSISATIYGADRKRYSMSDIQNVVDTTITKYCK